MNKFEPRITIYEYENGITDLERRIAEIDEKIKHVKPHSSEYDRLVQSKLDKEAMINDMRHSVCMIREYKG